jgi:hypothetical protein
MNPDKWCNHKGEPPTCEHVGQSPGKVTGDAEERASEIGYLFDKYEVFLSADMYDEIYKIFVTYGEEREQAGYERARVDLNAIHSAKWAKEDEGKGYRWGIAEAAGICEKYHEEIDGPNCMCDERTAADALAERILGFGK